MRIACIHIPQFALQCASRRDASLRGAPIAVVGGRQPVVLACSRAAWAAGVRLGMTATAARGHSTDLCIISADASRERETMRAIADALLAITSTVDLGGRVGAGGAHLAMYAEVPQKTRGHSFGERLVAIIDELGLSARIGIADDRFTAWVAAAYGDDEEHTHAVVSVPRGGSAAFLAPRPLSLLAISPEVQHMLEALGVRTLGEFAALPAPSVARPFEADYQALARGESDAVLRPYTPEAPIREEIVVSAGNVLELQDLLPAGEHAGGLSLGGAVAQIAYRIALRLTGRGRAAVRLEVSTGLAGEELLLSLDRPYAIAEELARVLAEALEPTRAVHADARDVWHLRVTVIGEAIPGAEASHEIFAEGSAPWAWSVEPSRAAEPVDAMPSTLDPLAIVLSSAGSLFSLSPPTRRVDSHRRTRRGKTRRTRPTPQAQSRLFDRRVSK